MPLHIKKRIANTIKRRESMIEREIQRHKKSIDALEKRQELSARKINVKIAGHQSVIDALDRGAPTPKA